MRLLRLLSSAAQDRRLSILIFHRVLPQPDPIFPGEVDAARFDSICRWVARWFHVLPLDEAVRRLRDHSLPPRALCITFDDGYADNAEIATPILRRHGLSATFFIATGFLDGGVMWNDLIIEALRRAADGSVDVGTCGVPNTEMLQLAGADSRRRAIDTCLGAVKYLPLHQRLDIGQRMLTQLAVARPKQLMLSTAALQGMRRAGMQIGAHTVHHPILATLDDTEAAAEIQASKHDLEQRLQERVTLFAYPNGRPGRDFVGRTVDLVRQAGFDAAVTTAPGVAGATTDLHQIPRFTPWDTTQARFLLRMGRNALLEPSPLAA